MDGAKVAEFWGRGFCLLEGVLDSPELDGVREVIAASVERRAESLLRKGHISDTYPDAPLDERWSHVARDAIAAGAAHAFRHGNWGQSQMLDECIYDLLVDPRLTGIAASVLGEEVVAHGDYWIRPSTKAVAASGVPMHQDTTYYAEELPPERAAAMYPPISAEGVRPPATLVGGDERMSITLWIPMVDVNEENGCLRFVEGSHRLGLLPSRRKPGSATALEPVSPPESFGAIVPVPMRVGDVLVFHHNTMHGSEGFSREDHVRWSIDLRYGPTAQPFDWHGNTEWEAEWPPFVARSALPERVTPWPEWEAKWRTPRHQAAPKL